MGDPKIRSLSQRILSYYLHSHKAFRMDKNKFYKNLPTLETSRLILRKVRLSDVDDIFEYASKKEVTKYLRWENHVTIEVTKQYIVDVLKEYSAGADGPWAIVFKPEKKVVGAMHLIKYNQGHKLTEVGYVLSQKYWNRRIMTEALQCVITVCIESLKFNRIQGMSADAVQSIVLSPMFSIARACDGGTEPFTESNTRKGGLT